MDLNLKKSLFGYNKLDVSNYVSNLNNENLTKIQDLQKQSMEAQDSLRAQIDAVRAEYTAEIEKLKEKIEELTAERDAMRRSNDVIADTLLGAQEYADNLRDKADQRAKERDEEHLRILESQQSTAELFHGRLRGLLSEIGGILQTAADSLSEKALGLMETSDEIAGAKETVGVDPAASPEKPEEASEEPEEDALVLKFTDEAGEEPEEDAAPQECCEEAAECCAEAEEAAEEVEACCAEAEEAAEEVEACCAEAEEAAEEVTECCAEAAQESNPWDVPEEPGFPEEAAEEAASDIAEAAEETVSDLAGAAEEAVSDIAEAAEEAGQEAVKAAEETAEQISETAGEVLSEAFGSPENFAG